jgi:hypothetical protein
MYTFWNVTRNPDQTFSLWKDGNGEPLLLALNESELMMTLEANSVTERGRESVLKQLTGGDKARVRVLKIGKFSRC